MSIKTGYYDENDKDIGEYFVDLCNNQTIYGTKTFTSIPKISGLLIPIYREYYNSLDTDILDSIPTGVNYCDIEICSGGGGGGGGAYIYSNGFAFGGTGGAGGTYYKIKLYITNFNRYNLKCGAGGAGGNSGYNINSITGISGDDGSNGNPSYIKFYNTDNTDNSYNLTVNGGGGGKGGIYSSTSNSTTPAGGLNKVYNNNGSYYSSNNFVFTPYIINSTFNQPSGGGYGSSYSSIIGSVDGSSEGSNGGSIYFNNENSNKIYEPCNVNVSASSLNPFNGGGGEGAYLESVGNGYFGGGGGGGRGYGGNKGNGGKGGNGFIKLYFY